MLVMHFIFLALIPSPSQKVIRKFLVCYCSGHFELLWMCVCVCVCVRVCICVPKERRIFCQLKLMVLFDLYVCSMFVWFLINNFRNYDQMVQCQDESEQDDFEQDSIAHRVLSLAFLSATRWTENGQRKSW